MIEIVRKRGDTYADEFIVKNSVTSTALSITGYTFLMTLDYSPYPVDSSANIYQLIGTIIDAPNGVIQFQPNITDADNVGNFYFDIQMTDPSGIIRTISSGKYIYIQDVTK